MVENVDCICKYPFSSVLINLGVPRSSMILSSVLTIRLADKEVSTSIASTSLLQSSITLKVLNFLLPTILSLIKSMLQLLLMAVCCCRGCFTLAGTLLFPFRFLFNFKNLYTR